MSPRPPLRLSGMAHIDTIPLGAPCWVELFTSDPNAARHFYGELFGWTAEAPNEELGGYVNLSKDGARVAGMVPNPGTGADAVDTWSIYLAVGDAEAAVAAASANGGAVHVPAMPIHALGSMAVVADSTGAAIGMWQPGEHRGFGLLDEPGAPAWFELFTRDHARALDFYRTVFGWQAKVVSDTDELRYATLGEGDEQRAGIMDASTFLPEGVPAHWSVYFATEDTDASVAQVVALGGTVVDPAQDTPYGRFATVADRTGARFKLRQPPAG